MHLRLANTQSAEITANGLKWFIYGNLWQPVCDWITRHRAACPTAIGGIWDKARLSYAPARGAACWQLDRPEPAVWSFLGGVESCHQDLQARVLWRSLLCIRLTGACIPRAQRAQDCFPVAGD